MWTELVLEPLIFFSRKTDGWDYSCLLFRMCVCLLLSLAVHRSLGCSWEKGEAERNDMNISFWSLRDVSLFWGTETSHMNLTVAGPMDSVLGWSESEQQVSKKRNNSQWCVQWVTVLSSQTVTAVAALFFSRSLLCVSLCSLFCVKDDVWSRRVTKDTGITSETHVLVRYVCKRKTEREETNDCQPTKRKESDKRYTQ